MNKITEICALNQRDDGALTQEELPLHELSFFKNPITNIIPSRTITIYEIFQLIKGVEYRELTHKLRTIEDVDKARRFKALRFDYVCFSGVFEKRSGDSLIDHSGLMVIDFDHLESVSPMKELLIVDNLLETELLFISPSGDGLKWIVKIDLSKASHHEYFIGIQNYLKFTYGVNIDGSGKDVARACFLSHDEDVFINPNISLMYKEFNPKEWQVSSSSKKTLSYINIYNNDVDELVEIIESKGVDITQGYETWRNIAFALINKFGSSARNYFHRISKFHIGYTSENCDKQFDSFLKSEGSGITIRSLFWIAKHNGITILRTNSNRNCNNPKSQQSSLNEIKPMRFPVHVFPDTIAEFVRKSAESINCPEDFIAIPMLSCFAMAMSNKRVVRIKKDWQEFAVLYAAIVSQPGTKKSPALNKAILPIKKLQNEFSHLYRQEKESYDKEYEVYENELMKWKSLKKVDRLNSEMPKKPKIPSLKQIFTSDATIESIMEMLSNDNSGVLCYMDELAGWIKGMNQYKTGGGNDLEKWLLLWSAILQIINRKGREPVFANNPFVNVVGGIQPDVLDVLSGKDNGLIDRILFAYPEEIPPLITDIEVSEELDNKLCSAFEKLHKAHFDENCEGAEPKISKFSKESYLAFKDYVNNHLYKEMTSYEMPYYLRGAWAKFPGYIARFALIIQGMNFGDNKKSLDEIDLGSLNKAIEIAEYFMEQAKKVHGQLKASKLDKQIEVLEKWINRRGGRASLREIYSGKVSGCRGPKDTIKLLEEMVDRELGKIEEIPPETGGRLKISFVLGEKVCNPQESNYNIN